MAGPARIPMEQKLLRRRHVDGDGCWIWTGGLYPGGYGKVGEGGIGGRTLLVHRAAFEAFIGPIPEGMDVLHRCDKPACFKPECLFTGTQADNMADMASKGRSRGGRRPFKLSEHQRIAIRRDGRDHGVIASEYGVSRSYVCHLKSARYTHLETS